MDYEVVDLKIPGWVPSTMLVGSVTVKPRDLTSQDLERIAEETKELLANPMRNATNIVPGYNEKDYVLIN